MAQERKTSGALVLIAWSIVIFCGLFVIHYGEDWYLNGQMKICSTLDTVKYPYGRYKPPQNPADLLTPPYWCAVRYMHHDKEFLYPTEVVPPVEDSTGNNNPLLTGTELGAYNDTYSGIDKSYGDDIIGHFFDYISAKMIRWLVIIYPIVVDPLISDWNSYFVGDLPENKSHRIGVKYMSAVILIAMIGATIKLTLDWLQEIVLLDNKNKKNDA